VKTGQAPTLTTSADRTQAIHQPVGAKKTGDRHDLPASLGLRWTAPHFDTSSPVGTVPPIPAALPWVPDHDSSGALTGSGPSACGRIL